MSIRKDYIIAAPRIAYAGGRPTTIVLHEVANQTSTLANEVAFVKRNWQSAFYHYLVDHAEAVELCDPAFVAYGAGPKINPYAIHIELVRDNGKNFAQAYRNYVTLAVIVAKRFGIRASFNQSREGFVTHHWVSNNLGGTDHTDPDGWLAVNGVSIAQLGNDILKAYEGDEEMTPYALNLLAQIAGMGPVTADDKFVKDYTGKGIEATLEDVLRSKANVETRTKANNYDPLRAAYEKLAVDKIDKGSVLEYLSENLK